MTDLIKKVISFCGLLLALLFVVAVYVDTQRKDTEKSVKVVEIKSSKLYGYKDGVLSWSVVSDYIWAGRSKYLFRAERILSGEIFDHDGQVVIDQIKSDNLRVNSKSKTLSAFNNVHARFKKREKRKKDDFSSVVIATNQSSTPEDKDEDLIKIKADELRYFSNSKRTYLYENVEIIQGEATIYPTKGVEVDNDKNIAFVDDPFRLISDEFRVTGNSMIIYIDDDYSLIKGGVQGVRLPTKVLDSDVDSREKELRSEMGTLSSDTMRYESVNNNTVIEASGNVRVVHGDKIMTATTARYNKQNKHYELEGTVRLISPSLEWLIDREKKKIFENPDINDAIAMGIDVTAQKLIFDASTKILTLLGDVLLVQKDKQLTCHKMVYDDALGVLTFLGDVNVIKDGQDEISCERLEVDIQNESFFAKKGVRSEFIVKKNK